jgi:hypothetical protein
MHPEAPQILVALEGSSLGAAIRQSTWIYPFANVGHILSLVLFVAATAIMDARLLGAFAATRPAAVIRPARRAAIVALLLMAFTGSLLFTAEASHIALNPVFQVKLCLIAFGIANALLFGWLTLAAVEGAPAAAPLPLHAKLAGSLSVLTWISVAACGRLIAYF